MENSSLLENIDTLYREAIEVVGEEKVRIALSTIIRQQKAKEHADKYWEEINKPIQFQRWDNEHLKVKFLSQYVADNGRHFLLDQWSTPILEALCLYFTNDERFEALDASFSLKKGIMIQGNVGSGKSSLMKIFAVNQQKSFRFVSCSNVAREYSEGGYKVVSKYMRPLTNSNRQLFFGQELLGWCFDDLGFEAEGKHYGKASNIMTELLQAIYDEQELRGMVHVTTNLTAKDIDTMYGNRIRSRMREMFNVLSYDKQAPDRRK